MGVFVVAPLGTVKAEMTFAPRSMIVAFPTPRIATGFPTGSVIVAEME